MSQVTVIITSCNRLDLLEQTMDSFMVLNTYPIERYILHNDGPGDMRKIARKYPFIEIITSPKRIGYSRSLDRLLSMVKTEWVWSTEDDWTYHQNSGFIEKSMRIMDEFPDSIHQVWVRDADDHAHPLSQSYEIMPGIDVRDVRKGYKKIWHGFSLNPGLRRMSDWKSWFPNGLAEFGDEGLISETMGQSYNAVSLVESSIKHLGWNRRSINFRA